ncbi:MAG: hypothetical protein ACO1O6_14440 [Bacteroidota bacterium]
MIQKQQHSAVAENKDKQGKGLMFYMPGFKNYKNHTRFENENAHITQLITDLLPHDRNIRESKKRCPKEQRFFQIKKTSFTF